VGSLNLPKTGRVCFDTQIAIYTVEQHELYAPALVEFWQSVSKGLVEAYSSELTLAEALVKPLRDDDAVVTSAFEAFLCRTTINSIPVSRQILRRASELRARIRSLRLPDAIHAATALSEDALLLTNDVAFRKVPALKIFMLDDFVRSQATPGL